MRGALNLHTQRSFDMYIHLHNPDKIMDTHAMWF